MNEHDSERILYYLEKKGYKKTLKLDESEIIVINTCSVREKAENRLFGHLGGLKRLKETRDVLICVGGCTAQSQKKRIQEKAPFVDIVFGTDNISILSDLIDKKLKGNENICAVEENGLEYNLKESKRLDSFRALIPVSIGCNNLCSYCIVPYVRGRERSLNPDKIIDAAKRFVINGGLQVTLLGQNVNSYGKDFKKDIDFSSLLKRVSNIEGLKRIRFMTSHPKDFLQAPIEVIRDRDNIMNHIHLPLQAGSNKILEMMNRKYSKEKYLDTVHAIRDNIKDCSITTDIIVGFPTEEEKDFKDTLDIIEKVRFDRVFTFIFSSRGGTPAAGLEDNVPLKEKKVWFDELLKVQNNISYKKNREYIGKKFKVLIEGLSHKNKGFIQGRLENNTVVLLKGIKSDIGTIKYVLVKEAKTFYVRGEIA